MHILLIEDEARVARFIAKGLKAEGYVCSIASDGVQGLHHAVHGDQDLIVLDRMLPGMDGLQVCQRLRQKRINTPVLMLTALDAVDERVEGLRAGADDYLVKPFDFEELLARLQALLRRSSPAAAGESLSYGPLQLDIPTRTARYHEATLKLTQTEFDLLRLLASTPERYWSRERILNRVWDTHQDPDTNVVDVYIGRLRKKLTGPDDVGGCQIETQRGIGYRLGLAPEN